MEDDMKGKCNFKLGALCAILGAMLLMPALGQAKEDAGAAYKKQKGQMIKELKLAPEKEKAVLAVEDKYVGERKEIIASVKKANEELQAAAAAANPDDAKLKQLISTLTTGQDKLFASFKNQRDEELALMTPVEQARYFQVLAKWRQKIIGKRHPKAAAEKE
jgi:hypothetical protein